MGLPPQPSERECFVITCHMSPLFAAFLSYFLACIHDASSHTADRAVKDRTLYTQILFTRILVEFT
jgi:hypothetical protein